TSVSGHSVIVKRITMPSMSDQELAEAIQKEAASCIPFDLGDVNLDYQILSEDAGNPQMDVLLVAVKKDKILNYTNVLSMAGRTPAIVNIDALALQNCYEYNYEPAPGQVVALLNLGASVTTINNVKIYLAGGSSKVPGLVEALRQEFSLPVEIFNPFQRIAPPAQGPGVELIEQNAGQLAVAVGLALRSFDDL